MTRSATTARRPRVPKLAPEVLTLDEVAAYLRVSKADVVVLATKHGLPGPTRNAGAPWTGRRMILLDTNCKLKAMPSAPV
jgi:hypothetical protein